MAEHRWRWVGEAREFPFHDLRDVDGDRVAVVESGDVVVTDSLAFGDEHPDLAVRLDKPRKPAKRAAASDEAAQEPQDDAEPATAGPNPED